MPPPGKAGRRCHLEERERLWASPGVMCRDSASSLDCDLTQPAVSCASAVCELLSMSESVSRVCQALDARLQETLCSGGAAALGSVAERPGSDLMVPLAPRDLGSTSVSLSLLLRNTGPREI